MDVFDSGVRRETLRSAASHAELQALWDRLESLRDAYFCGVALPAEELADLRAALASLDPRDLQPRHPHAQGIIDCALRELDEWEMTWPLAPGTRVAPSSFGALVLLYSHA